MLDPQKLIERLKVALPGSTIDLVDTTGTGDHFDARVVSAAFEGKSMIDQHQMVYAPLKDLLATGELHALALKTYTPEQWKKLGGAK